MAITLRGDKGTSLTHLELDNNFRSFFYSASYSGTSIYLYTSASLNNEIQLPMTPPAGYDYHIQFKEGNEPSGANANFTSSANFKYDFRQSSFKNTGSFYNVGSFTNTGNATIDGDLTVTGTVTAQEMRTEFNNSSVVFESGSTKFGDTLDDQHSFTGSLEIEGSLTSSADISIKDWGSISSSLQVLTSSIADLSGSVSANYLLNTTDTFTGDLTVTGRVNATEINTTYVTSSILYNSGSNIFGDSATDVHIFTGSILTEQSITGSDVRINQWGSVSASLSSLDTTISGLSTDYPDLTNIPNGIVSASAEGDAQGQIKLNGANVNVNDMQTDDSPTFADLSLTDFSSVSASLASLTAGTITINNDADNRILTANGNSTLNGESNLLFDGDTLTINGTTISEFGPSDTDIAGLVGSSSGSLIQGDENGHVVVGIRGNNTTDSFAIISGDGDYYSDTTYDKLAFKVQADGATTVGGNLTVSGSVNVTGDITAYHTSDARLKDNVTPIENALYKVKQIGGYEFDWNNNSEHSGHDVGVIAQEIEKVLPEVVAERDNGYKAVRYEKIVALLIEAVKQQQSQIDELKLDILRTRT